MGSQIQNTAKSPTQAQKEDVPYPKKRPSNLERLEKILKEIDESKAELQEEIQNLKSRKFSVGDFAIHKDLGNCIVVDFAIDISKYDLTRDYKYSSPSYLVGNCYLVSVPGHGDYLLAKERELLPANDTSKVLFKK